jgi:hypothetical protein
MISAFLPFAPASGTRTRSRTRGDRRIASSVLAAVLLLELALALFPEALRLGPVQDTPLFKQVSGYAMVALLVLAMAFGWLRRAPALAAHVRTCGDLHQFGGLLLVLLLAFHAGGTPAGFLRFTFHAMALAVVAGALRALLGQRLGRRGSGALLLVHVSVSCLVSVAALVHLYFVYAYTA